MSGTKRVSHEPVVWFPFSAGGMLAAILVPVHIVVFFIAAPLGLIEEPSGGWLHRLVTHPIGRVYLFVLVAGCLFHFAHRFRYVLIDLGLHGGRTAVAALCYGSAVAGSAWAGVVFFG